MGKDKAERDKKWFEGWKKMPGKEKFKWLN